MDGSKEKKHKQMRAIDYLVTAFFDYRTRRNEYYDNEMHASHNAQSYGQRFEVVRSQLEELLDDYIDKRIRRIIQDE